MTVLIALIIGSQAWGIVGSLETIDNEPPDFYFGIIPKIFACDPYENPLDNNLRRDLFPIWLKCLSWELSNQTTTKLFTIPFSIGLMPLVYWLGTYMTKDRLIGLISLTAFIFNPIFRDWNDLVTYDQVWSFFLLLSFLGFYKIGHSTLFFIMACLGKTLSIMYYPLFVYTAIKEKKYTFLITSSGVILISAAVLFVWLELDPRILIGNDFGFFPENWDQALFRNISIFWQVIPALLLFGGLAALFPAVRPKNQKTLIILMFGVLLMTPVIHLFTAQFQYTYRMIPFAAFMSIFIGTVIIQIGNYFAKVEMKKSMR